MPIKNRRYLAFTILELLVVISVLTILIAIGLPRIKGFMDNAKNAQARKELQTMQAALESYYTFSIPKAFPPTTTTVGNLYLTTVSPKIVPGILYDPFAGTGSDTEFNYIKSSNGKYYVIYSVGYNKSASSIEIDTVGQIRNLDTDDICVTNGRGCGAGELRCASGQSESSGMCCDDGTTNCSGSCVDLDCDISNCGSCGVACAGINICCDGACANPGAPACLATLCPAGI